MAATQFAEEAIGASGDLPLSSWVHLVPKEHNENLRWRKSVYKAARESEHDQRALRKMCSEDPLFYVNAFCWTYDPRLESPMVPFITYPFQDETFLDLNAAIGKKDICIKKSRDMGASWMLCTLFEWRWHFKDGQSFLLVSRNEEYVDKPGNSKCLFWKIDYLLKNQPGWLLPRYTRTHLRLSNEENGSSIDGESTTGDVARGDRRTAIGMDEFAAFDVDAGYKALGSTRDATRSRIFNSTPDGVGNAFYDVAHNSQVKQVVLHWTKHPVKAEGLYVDQNGLPRSPWYDEECKRCIHPQEIAQELDIDFQGSDFQFFDPKALDRLVMQNCRPPTLVGELEFDTTSMQPRGIEKRPNGTLRLWCGVDAMGHVVNDTGYVMGADISAGTGSSNSVLTIADRKTGEKVAELVTPHLRPDEFARYAVALARLFKDDTGQGAYMIWEAPGPGRNFGDVVMESGYRNVYWRTREESLSKTQVLIPGWWPVKDAKRAVFGDYRRSLLEGRFINRSKEAMSELREIIYTANGSIEHSKSIRTIDPSGARENHGDRPTADALCCYALARRTPTPVERVDIVPEDSILARRQLSEARRRRLELW
jgi:hypothetical protein